MVASTLSVGDIAIIGYNTGQNNESPQPATQDKLYFVLLKDIAAGTVIYITDRSWNGTAFVAGSGDGTFTYTAGADIAAGTVISITQAQLTTAGIDIDHNTGDTFYVYQGTSANAPTNFLYAAEFADGNSTFNGSLVNTGLVNGVSAVSVMYDSGAYSGPTTFAESFLWNGAGTTLLSSISDATNWVGDDSTGDNAREQEVQTGPWLVHADVEFWGTMGAGGLANTLADATFASGADDFNHTRQYDGVVNGTQVFWFARDMVFDTVDGKFFVADSTNGENRVLQGNISDLIANPTSVPTLTVLYQDVGNALANNIYAIDVDIVNNIVYFIHGSRVEKVGYNTANQTPVVLFDANVSNATSPSGVGNPAGSTSNFFNDMVINFNTGSIYMTSTRVVSAASGDTVTKNFIYELTGLTTSSSTNAFKFGANNAGTARLLPLAQNDENYNPSGSTFNPYSSTADPYAWPTERGTLDGLAIDQVNNKLYVSTGEVLQDLDGVAGGTVVYSGGVVAEYALGANAANGGANAVTILYQQTSQFGGAIPGLMGDLEIDTQNGKLYVLDYTGVNGVNDDNHWYRLNSGNVASTPSQFTQTIGDVDGAATVGLTLNHAPRFTAGTGIGGLAVTEASASANSGETSRVTLFNSVALDDVDTGPGDELTGAVVRIGEGFTYEATSTAPGHTGTVDRLYINNATSGTLGSGISYIYNQTTGAMVLTGAATVAEYKAAIELVQFSTSGDNVTNNGDSVTRKIYVSVSDGLTMSDEIQVTVSVTGINDAPVNTPGGAMNFTEDTTGTVGQASPTVIAPVNAVTGISIADADANQTSENFTVTLSVAHGTLTIRTDVTGGLTAGNVIGNGSATLTLTGTQNQINLTLAATTLPAQGSLANGLVYTPVANYNGADTLTITTNDQGNNGNDPGSTGTGTTEADTDLKTLNIADVNDAPMVGGDGTEDSPTILEDTPYSNSNAPSVASLFGGQFSDALDVQANGGNPTGSTGDSLAGIAITANGSNANGAWQYWTGAAWSDIGPASLGAAKTLNASTLIRFNPALNYNGAAPTLTATLIESGGPAITDGGTVNLSAGGATGGTTVYSTGSVVLSQAITAVNDAPVNTVGATVNINEDATNVVLSTTGAAMSVSDVDATGDLLYVLTVAHGTLTLVANVPGGIQSADILGNGTASITVTGTAAEINETLKASNALLYTPDANYNGTDGLAVYVNDGGQTGQDPNPTSIFAPTVDGATSEEDFDIRTINIAAVNDAPVVTTSAGQTAYAEDGAAAAIDASLTVGDVDNATLVSGTVSITANYEAGDVLSFTADAAYGNIAVSSYTNGVLTLTSAGGTATVAQWEAALRSVTYSTTSDAPGTGTRTVSYSVNDGAVGSNVGTKQVTVAATNDGPDAEGPAAAQTGTEDTDLVFSAANGNALSVVDPDAASVTVTLTVAHGTLSLSGTLGITFGVGDGVQDATMTFSGTVADVNAALEGLVYRGNLNYEGADQLNFDVSDNGSSGSGGTLTESYSVGITLADDGIINGGPGDDTLAGTSGGDLFYLQDGGNDKASGLDGQDNFYFGSGLTAADEVDGGANKDQLAIQGDYSTLFELGDKNLVNVETLVFLSGSVTRFGGTGLDLYDYNIKTVEANVASGQTLTVNWATLQANEDVIFDGRAETNGHFLVYAGAGNDTIYGGQLNDAFYFGLGFSNELLFSADDRIDGQGGTDDQIGLRGNYTVVFAETTIVNIETIALISGSSTRYGPVAPDYTYNITTHNGNVKAGEQLTINGSALGAGEAITFDGSNETDGYFRIFGGAGTDSLKGGAGNDMIYGGMGQDTMWGGGGNDTFLFRFTPESTSAASDWIKDFTSGADKVDLSMIDANSLLGGNQAFHWISNAAFGGTGAGSAGELRAYSSGGDWFVEGDTNGDGTADFVLHLTTVGGAPLVQGDFIP